MIGALILLLTLSGQTPQSMPTQEPIVFQLSRPDQPGRLTAELFTGSIRVRGTDTRDIVIRARVTAAGSITGSVGKAQGLERLGGGVSLEVEESDNHARILVEANRDPVELIIEVPRDLALDLTSRRGGDLIIAAMTGEIEARADQGSIYLDDVAGPVTAYAPYGEITGNLTRAKISGAMSFSSLRGDIDITLPVQIACELRMATQSGEVFSDFEMHIERRTERRGGERDEDGRFRASFQNALVAGLNGGGPRLSFTTLSGNLYIRASEQPKAPRAPR